MLIPKNILVTGGCGFIGSNFIQQSLGRRDAGSITNLDKLTYAGYRANLQAWEGDSRYTFQRGCITDRAKVLEILRRASIDTVVHFAAESHVDRSIENPLVFLETNVTGTLLLAEACLTYFSELDEPSRSAFRFLHVSTDEVYGSLNEEDPAFNERTPYAPNSPYSASKAASDFFVRAYHHTYGLPVLTTNCSNNYGPYQFPEKLIPLMILNALEERPLPVYGKGANIRDWLHVEDHVDAIWKVLRTGIVGETYVIGGREEKRNIDVVTHICDELDQIRPRASGRYRDLITFVEDRPGHDARYAMDASKIEKNLGWKPRYTFQEGISKTIQWYLENLDWCEAVSGRSFERERLGLGRKQQD